MKTDDIRERYLGFYEAKGHKRYPSDSLIPSSDPSLLFTSAGMAQFKDMFLGIGKLPDKRITTCQKCLRVGDLENVGRTARHHTFFEMLGNFSFGDYFKEDAIPWCWEFYHEVLGLPAERLWISVYEKDDEAAEIWRRKVGIPEGKIVRLGEADNFWPANAPSQGPNGPCGPCSEVYFDFGVAHGCGRPDCKPGCDCDRFTEIGNIVFTQFDRQDGGVLQPLAQKNIDFGGGLERVAAAAQGVHSNFEIDTFRAILAAEQEVLGRAYAPKAPEGRRFRRIADHIRAVSFCIADEARPSNEGRGYVVRRIIRTAFRDGWKLGSRATFLHRLAPAVVEQMKRAYPALAERQQTIVETLRTEEEQFLKTIERGMSVLEGHVDRLRKSGETRLGAEDAFRMYDTHGFPFELTVDVLADYGLAADLDGARRRLAEEQEKNRKSEAIFDPNSPLSKIKEQGVPTTEFLGYSVPVAELDRPVPAKVLRIVRLPEAAVAEFEDSKKDMARVAKLIGAGTLVESASTGDRVAVLLDRTPFYGEGGGQIGDAGRIADGDAEVVVDDCRRPDGYYFHIGRVTRGSLRDGRTVSVAIDAKRRLDIMRNHTGTHLLQAGLRAVLGPSVQQAGSVVEPHRLRFDFTHPKALTRDQIRAVEDWVNGVVFADAAVEKVELSMDEAKKRGAIMFFGDKYGDRVRVVSVGGSLSVELCGGTHLEHAATIGGLRITSESAIGSGVRRIEAVTGPGAVEAARRDTDLLFQIAGELNCPPADVPRKLGQMVKDVQDLKQEIARLRRAGGGGGELDRLMGEASDVGGVKVVAAALSSGKLEDARALMDQLTKKKDLGAGLLAVPGDKPVFVIGVREDLVKSRGLKAGDLAREVGKAAGGGGGGRELQAQAGGSDAASLERGLEAFRKAVAAKLG